MNQLRYCLTICDYAVSVSVVSISIYLCNKACLHANELYDKGALHLFSNILKFVDQQLYNESFVCLFLSWKFFFWMCHGFFYYNKLFNFSQRGSMRTDFLFCGSNCSNLLKISFFKVPFLIPGWILFKGSDKTIIS